jgi:CubicO group peptidase (beta-lactamase class C family)
MLAARLLTVLALSAPASVQGETLDEAPSGEGPPVLATDQVGNLDGTLEYIRQDFHIPGLAVGIVDNGVPVYARAFGVRDMSSGAPVTVHTLFHVASITKTLTATAVMQLAEKNQLALGDPLGRYLSDFANSPITITQLLTHSAGLQDVRYASATTEAAAVRDYVTKIARRDLAYPPGKGWEYSDTAFNLLGATIESVTRQSYADYMQANVLVAARMKESTFAAPDPAGNVAWPHTGEILVHRANNYPWDRAFLPSAGLNASVLDMMQWAIANLNRDPALLTPASYETIVSRQLDSSWDGMAMGLGWQLEKRGTQYLPRHAGAERGFSALLTLYPEQRRAIIILSNGETTPRMAIRDAIEATLARDTVKFPNPPLLLRTDVKWMTGLTAVLLLILAATTLWRRRT